MTGDRDCKYLGFVRQLLATAKQVDNAMSEILT